MTREDPQIKVRLPPEMRDRVKALAEQNNRSMNAEIVSILERALRDAKDKEQYPFDFSRLSTDDTDRMAQFMAKAVMVLIDAHPEITDRGRPNEEDLASLMRPKKKPD